MPEQNIETTIVVTKILNGTGKNITCIWSEHDYFKQQPCDFHLDKENYPENSVCCINQGYPSYKDNKKLYHTDYYILRQKTECINPPENVANYVCKEKDFKMHRARYDPVSGQILDLYEPIQYLVVRGDHEEQFLDYGFCKENSKILYSYHKRIIPSFFTGTFFNRYNISYQRCALSSKSLNAYFFLHSTTDRSEDTNRYLESVNLSPIDMKTFF